MGRALHGRRPETGAARTWLSWRSSALSRVIGLLQASADSDEPLLALAEDARAAGVTLDG